MCKCFLNFCIDFAHNPSIGSANQVNDGLLETCIMRLCSRLLFAIAILVVSTAAHADSILVGTDLANASGGSGLCPNDANCEILRQEFTLFEPVEIDQVKVVIGPYMPPFAGGDFNVALSGASGSSFDIGSGHLDLDSTQIFDFGSLDLKLDPGTYYLAVSGGNVTWAFAPSLPGLAGVLGPVWMSDPTINSRWQPVSGPHAMEIDGTAIAPEPSSWLLVGTGIFGLAGSVRRRIRHV